MIFIPWIRDFFSLDGITRQKGNSDHSNQGPSLFLRGKFFMLKNLGYNNLNLKINLTLSFFGYVVLSQKKIRQKTESIFIRLLKNLGVRLYMLKF